MWLGYNPSYMSCLVQDNFHSGGPAEADQSTVDVTVLSAVDASGTGPCTSAQLAPVYPAMTSAEYASRRISTSSGSTIL